MSAIMKMRFKAMFNARTKEWLIGLLFLGMSLYLFRVYARGQWDYTVKFLKACLETFRG